ncbi:unnamed protein product [Amoebophrya sp. A120]|nr:unnamed protein product [Amoebophrya sp. A120]|eukprot:GSA120T00007374001.1
MPPKAKPKAAAAGGEDETWEAFQRIYQKAMKQYGLKPAPDVEKILGFFDEGMDPMQIRWNFTEPLDSMGFNILMHSLREAEYKKISNVRLWKCDPKGDESVRAVCDYLESPNGVVVEDLQFTDNNVTDLGCEFIGMALGGRERVAGKLALVPPVSYLRLDYNHIGAKGVEKLAVGLAQNHFLRALSVQYCAIGPQGGAPLATILMYQKSEMEQFLLRGNELGDVGALALLKGVRRNQKLKLLDLADNKFSEKPEILDVLLDCFQNNMLLEVYRLVGNQISDVGAQKLIHGMIGLSHLKEVQVPERCSQSTYEALEQALGGGKKKKGKKGKKK